MGTFRSLVIFLFLGLAACVSLADRPFDNSGSISSPNDILAFIGKKVSVTRYDPRDDAPPDEDPDTVIYMDSAYKVRYEVLELVHGRVDGRYVDFKAYDHYGPPEFAETDIAMLYLVESDGALYHSKYQFDNVYPMAGGGFAGCGDPYVWSDGEEVHEQEIDRRPLQPVEFAPPVSFTIVDAFVDPEDREYYSAEELQEFDERSKAWYAAPMYEKSGGQAICRMGATPQELYRIHNEAVFLPQKWDFMCEYQIETEFPDMPWQEQHKAIDDCAEKLKALNSPFRTGWSYADSDELPTGASTADIVSYAIVAGETIADDDVGFLEPCLQYGTAINAGGDLVSSVLTRSPVQGLIWRADYENEETYEGVTEIYTQRVVCYQLPNAPPGQGYIMQIALVGLTMHPFLMPLLEGYMPE